MTATRTSVVAIDDEDRPEHGVRFLAPAALRRELDITCKPSKEHRRALKREYWDWVVAQDRPRGSPGERTGNQENDSVRGRPR